MVICSRLRISIRLGVERYFVVKKYSKFYFPTLNEKEPDSATILAVIGANAALTVTDLTGLVLTGSLLGIEIALTCAGVIKRFRSASHFSCT
jgi:hypothetical protein